MTKLVVGSMKKMSKQIDFAKQRREQARLLTSAVHEIATSLQPVAHQQGIEFRQVLEEAAARKSEEHERLTERLQESVVPLFIVNPSGNPERIGSCVLVRLDSDFFGFTAAHVLRDANTAPLFAPSEPRGGKLLPVAPRAVHLKSSLDGNDLDVGALALPARQLGAFRGHVFLSGPEIDREDRPDDSGLQSFYMVLGYSASRTQVNISKTKRQIHQQSFRCSTQPVEAAEYIQERVRQPDHILLDFDHKEMRVEGRRVTAPKLQGVSGGGIFQIGRRPDRAILVAIATQNRRRSRLIVGTRIKHFLSLIREAKTTHRDGSD